jgi:hypothetical protein
MITLFGSAADSLSGREIRGVALMLAIGEEYSGSFDEGLIRRHVREDISER